jgi:molybdopterin-containing oxidoreductase family membrane subunit
MAHEPAGQPPEYPPVLKPGQTYATVSDHISALVLHRPLHPGWLAAVGVAFAGLMLLFFVITLLLTIGVGIWGVNVPVAWGFAIINFVWWIGIGHAGTLISAFLLLMRQRWRQSINRFAEAMTIFAVCCAGLFPLMHLGRPWFFYWMLPYPSATWLWPQWRSPLVWDVFAVMTYLTVSVLFWYMGLLPDLATLRDRARRPWARFVYGLLALGWRGSARHWQRYETAYLLMAGLATPLVISVHSIVSLDFAVANLPGWHSTIFPPYFVAGAVFSGFAMVLVLTIPLRKVYGLEGFITERHLENMAKLMLATGLIVAYGYVMEYFMAWLSGKPDEMASAWTRITGPYGWVFFGVMLCNVLIPQSLWFRQVRTGPMTLFGVSLAVLVGMWLERFMIVVTPLSQGWLPSSWGMYYPTIWDWGMFAGTIGLFFFLFLLFLRALPMISIFELRELVDDTREGAA